MILRILRGIVADPAPTEPSVWLEDALGRVRKGRNRPLAAYLGWRVTGDGASVAIVTAWKDAVRALSFDRDIRAFDRTLHAPEPVLYECEISDRSPAEEPPGVLRIAAGWIERGPEAEIQQELRRRLPGLGPELLDAYVGRRIRGRSVEILLVATWTTEPPDHPLDEPLWPDITARYREFLVETYEPAVCG
jgi:hypothetical protein